MPKRRDLLKQIANAARVAGVRWEMIRQGGNHEVWRLGDTKIPIPRHNEIGGRLARAIREQAEPELGEGWWK